MLMWQLHAAGTSWAMQVSGIEGMSRGLFNTFWAASAFMRGKASLLPLPPGHLCPAHTHQELAPFPNARHPTRLAHTRTPARAAAACSDRSRCPVAGRATGQPICIQVPCWRFGSVHGRAAWWGGRAGGGDQEVRALSARLQAFMRCGRKKNMCAHALTGLGASFGASSAPLLGATLGAWAGMPI
jgi:hypothetical protein